MTVHEVLLDELKKPEWDGLDVETAHQRFNDGWDEVTTVPNHIAYSPVDILGSLGIVEGRKFLGALRAALGDDFQFIAARGVDLNHPVAQQFLAGLQQAGAISSDTLTALTTMATTQTTTKHPAILNECFQGIKGLPNRVDLDEFITAWKAAGR